jgi:SynChlorMet cassette radical SAM/SPASM protein ScmF
MKPAKELVPYPLHTIYFYLTQGCNLLCRHCWINPKHQASGTTPHKELPPETFESIIQQAKALGLTAVKLTGGEPFLHSKFGRIIEIVRKNNLRLILETNGTLCTSQIAREMSDCKDPFVSVSLDGADAETHDWVRGVKGAYRSAMNGIRVLSGAGLATQIIMTLMRRNVHQIEEIVALAEDVGANSIKFNILQPTARGERLHENNETLGISELVRIGEWMESTVSSRTRLKVIYDHPPAFRPLGKILGGDSTGCSSCGILGILGVLADGSFALCGIGENVTALVFGTAQENRLENIWNDTTALNELREGLPAKLTGICSKCLMNHVCFSKCIAQNYYRSKNLWTPFWYCEQAMNAGLFPETRIRPNSGR